MSKAYLVMNMPSSCDKCDLVEMVNGKIYCGVPGCGQCLEDYIMCRPNWCPLREFPQKYDEKDYTPIKDERYENGYEDGYNTCIDEIMIGGEENG